MRLPVRSEADAFRLTCAVVLGTAVCVLVGYWLGRPAGLVVLLLMVGATIVRAMRIVEPASLPGSGGEGEHRVLLVANETVSSEAVWEHIRNRDGRAVEVLAPVLQSRTHFVTTDIDRETATARRRLQATLDAAHQHGVTADGRVGDPISPLEALADELRRFNVDEVIVATHDDAHRNWLETDMLARIREALDVPVTQIVLDDHLARAARAD